MFSSSRTGRRFASSGGSGGSKSVWPDVVEIGGASGGGEGERRHRNAPLQLLRRSGEGKGSAVTATGDDDVKVEKRRSRWDRRCGRD